MAINNGNFNEMKHSDLNEFFAYVHPTNVTGLNSNNKLITSIPGHGSFNYGNTLIHSQTESVYKWTFKIMEGGRSMVIGIFGSNSKDVWVTDNKWAKNTLGKLPAQRAYGMLGKGKRVIFKSQVSTKQSDYGSKINTGDIITMTLDLINKQLSFTNNNYDFGVAFEDIMIGENFYYHLMIKFGIPQKVQSVAIQSLYKIANDTFDLKHHVRSDLKHRSNNEPGSKQSSEPVDYKHNHVDDYDDNIAPFNAQTLAQLNQGQLNDNEIYDAPQSIVDKLKLQDVRLDSSANQMEILTQNFSKIQDSIKNIHDQFQLFQKNEEQKYNENNLKKEIDQMKKTIQSLMNNNNNNIKMDKDKQEFQNWINNKVKLPQYYDIFVENGIETLNVAQLLTINELNQIGISMIGHKMQILSQVAKLKQKSNAAYQEGNFLVDTNQ